jgi:Tol biopolymer transport system component
VTEPKQGARTDLDRVVDAISDGEPVEWDAERAGPGVDAETLEALRLIEGVARAHRGGSAAPPPEPEPDDARTWGNLVLRERIGAGAHGEVYRAFDPGLRREVALKLWHPTQRPRRIEELLREGRALAHVRHPNVLLVHGADVHDGRVGMWTELVDGATLEHLLAHFGPCTWREAALLGIDLCRALAAVHATGVVHCDVKGSNVMRERGGRVVLMDFGSAGIVRPGEDGEADSVEGTPLAMAPEVLSGESATPSSDLYGLGVVLFRQITSRFPVEAGSLAELRERHAQSPAPSLRALRAEVPLAFAEVVDRALERDPGRRPASAIEMERMFAQALSSDWAPNIGPAPAGRTPRAAMLRRAITWSAVAAALVLVFAGVTRLRRAPEPTTGRPLQFKLQLPAGEYLPQYANVAVAPDGERVAFASVDTSGRRAVWVRRFDALESTRIPGTEGARFPFWSADSRDIAFFSNGDLKRVSAAGGPVRIVCRAEMGRGGSWSRLGTILFASSTQGPLYRVPADGGTPIPATTLDSANAEVSHRWPYFLPDGDHFLYVKSPAVDGTYSLFVGSLRSDRRAYVGEAESGAEYGAGLLVYVLHRTLEARPFDLHTLRWSGQPVPISNVPGIGGSLAEPHASVSQNGMLVYSFSAAREGRLRWFDTRTGNATPLASGPYFDPALSPDGTRVAAERIESTGHSNIWMLDAQNGRAERWTDDGALNRHPHWSPAGDSIVFASNRSGSYELFARSSRGSLAERRVYSPAGALLMWVNDWHRGGLMTFDRYDPGTGYDVFELRSGTAVPIAHGTGSELHGVISPDARWLAFESDVSGSSRIYLVDRRTSERFVLPGDGGLEPRWARATGRLYYHAVTGRFFEVTPLAGRPPDTWPTRALFRSGILAGYDIDAYGRRVLCSVLAETDRPDEIGVLANLPAAVARGL